MDRERKKELLLLLQARKHEVAHTWYQAIARDCYMPFSAADVQERLAALVYLAGELLLAETWDAEPAIQIGHALVRLHCLQGDVLGQTIRILGDALVADLDAEEMVALQPRVALLLGGVGSGYFRYACAAILDEQEQIRSAVVGELRATELALREAHDSLEARVEQRTAELAAANQNLVQEIAERRRVEGELRESEDRWRTLVHSVPDLVVLVDFDGIIRFINRMPENSGASVDRVIGTPVASYYLPDQRKEVEGALQRILTRGESAHYEVLVPLLGGGFHWRATRGGPVRRDGQIVGALLVSRDVSERKRLEEMKDNLIRDVSHELRTPLAKVQMSLELLAEIVGQDEIDGARALRIGDLAARNVRRLLETVEGILDLSRLDAGILALDYQEIDLAALMDEVAGYVAPQATAKGLDLVVQIEPELPPLQGDREKLFRVLANLVENSCKFSKEGQIVVSLEFRDGVIAGAVSDQGDGILPENLDRIFDRFFQERPNMPGVGIGLTICKNIIEAHGGRIWAESAGRGQGTTFRFVLPALTGNGREGGE